MFNERTKINLKDVRPELVELWTAVNKIYKITCIEGKRSAARQAELLRTGKSKRLDGKHTTEPLSEATDVVPTDFNWNKPNSFNEIRKCYFLAGIVKAVALDLGFTIRYGGDWDGDNDFSDQTFNDLVHYEIIL